MNWVPKKTINKEFVDKLLQSSIDTNQFTNGGPIVKLLENTIREKLQVNQDKAVIATASGAVALHALVSGIQFFQQKSIEWATQSFTFPSAGQGSLTHSKIVDIDEGGGLDLEKLEQDITGIIVTNIFGNSVDIDKYLEWSNNNDKFLIFDNAATPLTFYRGQNCVNYGTGSIISFHHTKPIGFGEGGAVIVDKQYEDSIRGIMNFGIGISEEYWLRQGSNYKMSDIAAVYILQYLETIDNIISVHTDLYRYLVLRLKELNLDKEIKLFPNFGDKNKTILSCFCLLFENYDDKIKEKLLENNIFCRKYYIPLEKTEIASMFFDKILCIPCTVDMKKEDIDTILNLIIIAISGQ